MNEEAKNEEETTSENKDLEKNLEEEQGSSNREAKIQLGRKREGTADLKEKSSKTKKTRFEEKEIERAEYLPMNVGYKIIDGIRYLDAYWAPWRTRTKGRWIGKKLVECFAKEFLSANQHYALVATKLGRIYVNGQQLTDPDYVLKNGDLIEHWGHRHEHPILDCEIKFVANTEDLLVVDKPASLPVHSCGQYSIHTVIGMLRVQHNITGLRVLHRLDRTTSGILMFAKNYETDLEFKETLKKGHWSKEYVCKVDGVFPEEEILCEQRIGTLVVGMGIQCVRDDGKDARTRFKRLWTDGKTSVLRAKIDTGRTHQIRVHAQFLGHPIVGDQLYNSTAWGPDKGKNAEYHNSFETLAATVRENHKMTNWLEEIRPGYEEMMEQMASGKIEVTSEPPFMPREQRPEPDPICLSCNVVKKPPTLAHFSLYLHCLRYETEKWSYETKLPSWAIQKQ